MSGFLGVGSAAGFPLRLEPQQIRAASALTASYVASTITYGVAGFNRFTFQIAITADLASDSIAQVRVFWRVNADGTGVNAYDLRRDETTASVDDLIMPTVPAGTSDAFAFSVSNPGGMSAVGIEIRENGGGLPGTAAITLVGVS